MRDFDTHKAEMCELQRTLDNEMKLQEFLGVKGQYRRTIDLQIKQEAERVAKRQEQQDKIATYTHILDTIKEFTGDRKVYDKFNLKTHLLLFVFSFILER